MASTTITTSQHILASVGGAENVSSLTHCATRLRFQLVDQSRMDQEKLESDPAVLGVVKQGSTGVQVIMGGGVAEYYKAIQDLPGMGSGATRQNTGKKEYSGVRGRFGWVDYCFEFLSDTFRPVLWALLGASLIITVLVLLDTAGVQDFRQPVGDQPPTFQFLHAMFQSVFYFLPVMVGATAARKLGANEWVGAAIPAALFTPDFLGMKDTAEVISTAVEGNDAYVQHVFGLPMYIQEYGGQVFPPIFAAIILFFIEKLLKKIIPGSVQMVFVPFFSLLIMIPLTAFLVGPFGIQIGNFIANFLYATNDLSPFILAVVIPLLYPFLVPLGLHWPLNAIMIVNINTLGYDFIQGPMGTWNFACFGVITGVFVLSLMERNQQMRQVSAGGMFAGLLGGISEPSLYGVLLRYRRSYYRLLPGCLAGGIVAGIFDIKANAFVFTSLLTIPAMDPWLGYAVAIAVAFAVGLSLTLIFDYRTKEEKAEMRAKITAEREAANEAEDERIAQASAATAGTGAAAGAGTAAVAKAAKPALQPGAVTEIPSPLAGTAVSINRVPDEAFASGALGNGIAIEPTGDTVYAPADGSVIAAQKTGHAVGLRLDSGVDLLIHIGVDTVKMDGKGFELFVERKQRVKAGDKLVRFDRAAIADAGYPDVTLVLVSNTRKFGSVDGHPAADVVPGETNVITVTAKADQPATAS